MISYRSNFKIGPHFFPKRFHRIRARIEKTMGKIKRFKRITPRREKTTKSFNASVSFACDLIWINSVRAAQDLSLNERLRQSLDRRCAVLL